jgi:Tol biopolymer transport system component
MNKYQKHFHRAGAKQISKWSLLILARVFSFSLLFVFLIGCAQAALPSPTATILPSETATLTATATATSLPTSTPTLTPTPMGGGNGKFIFEYGRDAFETDFPGLPGKRSIFIADWDGSNLAPLNTGSMPWNNLADVSPDGRKALVINWPDMYTAVDSTSAIYVVDLEHPEREPVQIAHGIMYSPNKTAIWLDNTRIVLADKQEGRWGVFLVNSDGTGMRKLSKPVSGVRFYDLRSSPDGDWVFWHGFDFQGRNYMDGGYFRFNMDDGQITRSPAAQGVSMENFSPDGTQAVWVETESGNHWEKVNIASVSDLRHPTAIDLEKPIFYDYTQVLWSPDGNGAILNRPTFISKYAAEPIKAAIMMFSFPEEKLRNIYLPSTLSRYAVSFLDWSPDGTSILVRATPVDGKGKTIFGLIDLETRVFTEVLTNLSYPQSIGTIDWVP